MEKVFKQKLNNNISCLPNLLENIEIFCIENALNDKLIFEINVIADELVRNIIRHGYADTFKHFIDVNLQLFDDKIELEIIDDGKEFNPLEHKNESCMTNLKILKLADWELILSSIILIVFATKELKIKIY
jgi:anti-sigma regulatory factor (Ser/Thr protein kinase)